tara:strand:+ start:39 stop:503 length:465 start_codon:yes stop_codon:yes gene_type:complete
MSESYINSEINFYFIKSNFSRIVSRLCFGLLKNNLKTLINLKDKEERDSLDRFLWLNPKDRFLPHKTNLDTLNRLDNIILFEGDYLKMSNFKNFKNIIISPSVKIKSFQIFTKFLVFSDFGNSTGFEKKKKKLENLGYNVKSFLENQSMKWTVY